MDNPHVDICFQYMYTEGKYKTRWAIGLNLGELEKIADDIMTIYYPHHYKPYYFVEIKKPRRIIEEMIHACLPSPDERLAYILSKEKNKNNLWKQYLHFLLTTRDDIEAL